MGRVRVLLLLWVCVIGVSAPADAWWGWIDELSGPKGFKGMQFDVRLKCFGAPENSVLTRLRTYLVNRTQLNQQALTLAAALQTELRIATSSDRPQNPEGRVSMPPAGLVQAVAALVTLTTPADVDRTLQRFRGDYVTADKVADVLGNVEFLAPILPSITPWIGATEPVSNQITALASKSAALIAERESLFNLALATVPFVGIRLSLCEHRDDDERRFSVAALTRFYATSDHSAEIAPPGDSTNFENFANGHTMRLFTAGPAIEWRPLYFYKQGRDPNTGRNVTVCPQVDCQRNWGWDWIDLGASASYYRIDSSGFAPLNGTVISAYGNLHLPAHVVRTHPWTRAIPVLRIGRTGFVGGFKANAFGPKLTGPKAAQIDGPYDWTWERSLFIDLGSIF